MQSYFISFLNEKIELKKMEFHVKKVVIYLNSLAFRFLFLCLCFQYFKNYTQFYIARSIVNWYQSSYFVTLRNCQPYFLILKFDCSVHTLFELLLRKK